MRIWTVRASTSCCTVGGRYARAAPVQSRTRLVHACRDRGMADSGALEESPDQAGLVDEIELPRNRPSLEIDPCDSVRDILFRLYPVALHPPEKVRTHAPGAGVDAARRPPLREIVHLDGAPEIRQRPVEPGSRDPCAGDGDPLRDLLCHGPPLDTLMRRAFRAASAHRDPPEPCRRNRRTGLVCVHDPHRVHPGEDCPGRAGFVDPRDSPGSSDALSCARSVKSSSTHRLLDRMEIVSIFRDGRPLRCHEADQEISTGQHLRHVPRGRRAAGRRTI